MNSSKRLLGLDVGSVRIGVALADTQVRLASPYAVVAVDGGELAAIRKLVDAEHIDTIVVGYPRNQSGEATAQTTLVEAFAKQLEPIAQVVFQDESLTSVLAEERLKQQGGAYQKEDIDKVAASIILQDYVESHV